MFRKIYWKYSLKILVIVSLISIGFPFLFLFWFLLKFDIPFVHGGDKIFFKIILLLWWLSFSVFIFGWNIKNDGGS